jgi:hypothetical protein
MKLADMKVDPLLIEQGDWVSDIPNLPGIRIKARGIGNADYRKQEARMIRQIPRGQRIHGLSPQDQDRILGQLLLDAVVLDVEGLEDDVGNPLPYTKELGKTLLLDPQFRVFREGAAYAGGVVDQQQKADVEADAKN